MRLFTGRNVARADFGFGAQAQPSDNSRKGRIQIQVGAQRLLPLLRTALGHSEIILLASEDIAYCLALGIPAGTFAIDHLPSIALHI
jgi:hypothetical protein